jgi:hypothetical protein
MNTVDHEASFIVIAELQNLVISRYFSAAGLVLLLYDTVLTIEDEVSGPLTQLGSAYFL